MQASRTTGIPELDELELEGLVPDELELDDEEELDELELDEDELEDSLGSVPPPQATNSMLNKPAPASRVENPLLIRMLMKISPALFKGCRPRFGAAFYSALLYCRKFHIWGIYSHYIQISAAQHIFFCPSSQFPSVNFFLFNRIKNFLNMSIRQYDI